MTSRVYISIYLITLTSYAHVCYRLAQIFVIKLCGSSPNVNVVKRGKNDLEKIAVIIHLAKLDAPVK